EAPNSWVTRSTDSTSSWGKVRTCDAPDSSAANKRVTDSFMLGHFTHLKLTSCRANFVVVHWDRHHQGDPDAKRLHTALVLWRCAAVQLTCVLGLLHLLDHGLQDVRRAGAGQRQ